MIILVTGGLGFIGSHTVVELINKKHKVILVDNLSNSKLKVLDKIQMITGVESLYYNADVTDLEVMEEIFLNNKIDGVIHFAGVKAVEESIEKPLKYYRNNIFSTIVLSQLCVKFEVEKFVFSSSATVYGDQESPLKESMSLKERTNPYGETKAMNEKILFDLSHANSNLDITILRYFNPVGAHRTGILGEDPVGLPSNLMPLLIKVATGDLEKLNIFGNDYDTQDGTAIRDYIHVVDLAKGHIKAIENKNKGFNIFNLGTGQGTSVLELINAFMKVNRITIPYQIVNRRVGDVGVSYADVSKAKKEINWTAELNILDMVRDSWNYKITKIIKSLYSNKTLSQEVLKKYIQWIKNTSAEEKRELLKIRNNVHEIQDRFYKELSFGTGGLRGKIGLGSNRMNIYTVGKATRGLSKHIKNMNKKESKVLICFDTREKSRLFAETAASILAANDISVIVFKESRPTPELSFAIQKLSCDFGIVITASHNPPEYNGYKIYQKDGVQIVPSIAKEIMKEIKNIDLFEDVKKISFVEGLDKKIITEVLKTIDNRYFDYIKENLFNKELLEKTNLKVLYTALHGTGAKPISTLCRDLKISNYEEVKEQMIPDEKFGSLVVPNPEMIEAFDQAVILGKILRSEIILGTDPDCDRVGLLVRNKEAFHKLNGNQIGVLLLNYILENVKKRDKDSVFIKTIVTSDLAERIALKYGINVINTLTGFKYIGEKICALEESNQSFLFAYEESNGYLYGNEVRDKDGVMATLLIIDMAAYYKERGKNLIEVLEEIHQEHGFFIEELKTITLSGILGDRKNSEIMNYFRNNKIVISGFQISQLIDYKIGINNLPKANVLKFIFNSGGWFVVRPSGTESKIKFYFSLNGTDSNLLDKQLRVLIDEVTNIVERI